MLGVFLTVLKFVTLGIAVCGILGVLLVSLFHQNRLLFRCLVFTFAGHLGFAGVLWAASVFIKPSGEERLVAVAFRQEKPPISPKELPPQPERKMDIPLGKPTGQRNVKIKKGTTTKITANAGAKGQKTFGNQRTISTLVDSGGEVVANPDDKGDIFGPGDSLDVSDIANIGKGGGGDDWGVEDGDPNGGIPLGFPNGKIGGRVYFVRLKHGSGAWNAYDEGTRRLLSYVDKNSFPCQSETWPMTANELRKRYMSKGVQPTFLYLYCDESFSLSNSEVAVLREYMDKGGFLFLDSRPDPIIKDRVAREIDKVLPGSRLSPVANSHAINSYLYRLSMPGVGENIVEKKNYGITREGRLVVFFTMGNFSHLYQVFQVGADEYTTAQYQMGVNVIVYAITKADATGIAKKKGADAAVTTQALEHLMNSIMGSGPSTDPNGGPSSVKVKPEPVLTPDGTPTPPEEAPDTPDEINVIE